MPESENTTDNPPTESDTSQMRVFRLAQLVGLDSKELMAHCQVAGVPVQNSLQSLSAKDCKQVLAVAGKDRPLPKAAFTATRRTRPIQQSQPRGRGHNQPLPRFGSRNAWMRCSCRNADAAYDLVLQVIDLKDDRQLERPETTGDDVEGCVGFWLTPQTWSRLYETVEQTIERQSFDQPPDRDEETAPTYTTWEAIDCEVTPTGNGLSMTFVTSDGEQYACRLSQSGAIRLWSELLHAFGDPPRFPFTARSSEPG